MREGPAQPPKAPPGKGQAKATRTPFIVVFYFFVSNTQVPPESPLWQGLTLARNSSFALCTDHREGPPEPQGWNRHSWNPTALQSTKQSKFLKRRAEELQLLHNTFPCPRPPALSQHSSFSSSALSLFCRRLSNLCSHHKGIKKQLKKGISSPITYSPLRFLFCITTEVTDITENYITSFLPSDSYS